MKRKTIIKIFASIVYFVVIINFSDALNAQTFQNTHSSISNNTATDLEIYNWIKTQQVPNGLIKNTDNSKNASLYNNAITAILFISENDLEKAAAIFDYYEKQLPKEFNNTSQGFSQMRTIDGEKNNRTWMGDNAWLLIALNTYHSKTNSQKYSYLSKTIENWLRSLQDDDGGLWGGMETSGKPIPKNTEGMLDAYHAVLGFDMFHIKLLNFLKNNRWNSINQYLTTTEENHRYAKALDLHSWSFCMLEDFPVFTLLDASKFLTTHQTTSTQQSIHGYCFDTDTDCVWLEGTAQMAIAYQFNNDFTNAHYFRNEMSKSIITSKENPTLKGLPYVTNNATNFGREPIWENADLVPSISGSVWYLFASKKYNPFEIHFKRNIPTEFKFWINQ